MLFRQIFDPKLAQYAYLIGCQQTKEAVIIDPERDIDQYLKLADQEGVEIVAVAETHIHADFLSGAREFAERFGTRLFLSDEGDENWKYEWVKNGDYNFTLLKDGDRFTIGNIEIQAVHTPGHTPEHLAYMVTDRGGGATEPMGMVTGDFVFVGDLGRPDLLESAAKVEGMMKPSARRLYGSALDFLSLDEYVQVWPGHGAGSACGKALGAVPETTVGYEKRFNPALAAVQQGEDAFVDFILEGQPEPPLYFARMKRDNKHGAPVLGDLPRPRRLTERETFDLVERDHVRILDTRADRSSFMAQHLPGSLYTPLNKTFNTAVGSLVEDEKTPLYLITGTEHVEEAVRDLVRIGYDNVVGYVDLETLERYVEGGGRTASIEAIDLAEADMLRMGGGVDVLDVRFASEYNADHMEGAVNASYTRLPEYLERIPESTLAVHCGTGARAAVAASYLAREGRAVRWVNDDFATYRAQAARKALAA